MNYYVYVLFSIKDKMLYTGFTTDLKNRVLEHSQGEVQSTKNRRPLKLIHYEYFINERDANQEKFFLKVDLGGAI